MDKFEIGEIAIIESISCPEYNGQETTILSIERNFEGIMFYQTTNQPMPRKSGGLTYEGWAGSALRKRRPPTELSTWEEVQSITGWNPTKQTIEARNGG